MTPPADQNSEITISGIEFLSEDLDFQPANPEQIKHWIFRIIQKEDKELEQLNFIFCSDSYLLQINQQYLDHDTYTDIITFPYGAPPMIEGDIFISIDRIKENAATYADGLFEKELHRVIIHGVLHLCGYKDKSESEAQLMRQKEDEALEML